MKSFVLPLVLSSALLLTPTPSAGQQAPTGRPATAMLDIAAPSAWVRGALGEMRVVAHECRSVPPEVLRRRIVEVAAQEWAFFGFPVLDRLNGRRLLPLAWTSTAGMPAFENTTRRPPAVHAREAERVAASIAGYWAVTPEGRGVISEQNRRWDARGAGARWHAPWSAAFISWVMCEGGLATNDRFRRAVAHWTYVDQAIRARDGQAPAAAFEAFDIGERTVQPGDLLCAGRRPAYRNLAERRRQLGTGARSHCDVVVALDESGERILAIGGNVLRSVSLKVLAAERAPGGGLRARTTPGSPLFAHLQLRAPPIEPNPLADSPVLAGYACTDPNGTPDPATYVLRELGFLGSRNAGDPPETAGGMVAAGEASGTRTAPACLTALPGARPIATR